MTAVGFGNRFTDPNMGATGDVIPDERLKEVYAVQFSLLRAMIEDKPAGGPGPGSGTHPDGDAPR